jgi:hypothetical protein
VCGSPQTYESTRSGTQRFSRGAEVSQISAKDGLLEFQLVTIGSAHLGSCSPFARSINGRRALSTMGLRTLQIDEDVARRAPKTHSSRLSEPWWGCFFKTIH